MTLEAIGRPMEILLVEDSLLAARLAMGALEQSRIEHRLTWCNDGQDARDFLRQNGKFAKAPRPDLVLLDLSLPSVDGRALLHEIRQTDNLKDVAVVIMTGTAGDCSGAECRSSDVQGFLVKPIDLNKFLSLLERLKTFWKTDMIVGESGRKSLTQPDSVS